MLLMGAFLGASGCGRTHAAGRGFNCRLRAGLHGLEVGAIALQIIATGSALLRGRVARISDFDDSKRLADAKGLLEALHVS